MENAEGLAFEAPWLWRYWARLHEKRKDTEKQIDALEVLDALGEANGQDLCVLGIAHHNRGNFAKALEFYGRSSAAQPDPAPLRNMGLVYNHPEVSQDVDAVDAYRRALLLKPDYDLAANNLAEAKRKLTQLAARAIPVGSRLLKTDEWFQFYVNPFEMLNLEGIEDLEEIDEKLLQRSRKLLFSEIELNDGKIGWMDNAVLDKAQALAVVSELDDPKRREYHWEVFQKIPLLNFMTRGDIKHFVYSEDYFPWDTLQLIEADSEFRQFLSKPFAQQYNLVLTRAIEHRHYPVIEVLFDGRRWVLPEHDDICFAGAYKRVGELVSVMETKAKGMKSQKPSPSHVEAFLKEHGVVELLNLLPTAFRDSQTQVVAALRNMAIDCWNVHSDADLSYAVLNLSKQFQFKSVELTKRLDEDFKQVQNLIAEERKHESKLQFGQRPFEITKDGVLDGERFFPADSVKDIKWGILVTGYTGMETYNYALTIRDEHNQAISKSWTGDAAKEKEQTKHFNSMVDACVHYLVPVIHEKAVKALRTGQTITIGTCRVSHEGVVFKVRGILFEKEWFLPWSDVGTELRSGQLRVYSKTQPSRQTSMAIMHTENAILLQILRAEFEDAKLPPKLKPPLTEQW